MTEYQRRQIAAYLPSPRDKTLNDFEYYVLDTADRIRKVYVRDILPHDEETTYGCYEVSTNRRIDAGWGNEFIGFRFGELYDNAEDCRNRTHSFFNGWEELRKIQEAEEND